MSATMSDMHSWGAGRGRVPALLAAVLACTLWLVPAAPSDADTRDIVLVLDNSGSMRKNDPQFLARVAVRTFLEGLEGDNRVALVLFDQSVRLLMPLTPLDASTRAQFLTSLEQLDYRGQLTNTPAGLERALYELRVSGRPGSEPIVILMTDGIVDVAPEGPDPGDVEKTRWLKSTLSDEAADSNVRIFGIAFTDDADFELMQTLANRSGGQYYRALRAADIDAVFKSVSTLLADTRAPAPTPPRPLPADPPAPTAPFGDTAPVTGAQTAPQPPAPFALPDTGSPPPADTGAAVQPEPDTGAAVQPEPDTGTGSGFRLPEVALPDTDLPAVSLPDVKLPGEKASAAPSPPGTAGAGAADRPGDALATDAPAAAAAGDIGAGPDADTAAAGEQVADADAGAATPPARAADDSSLLLPLAVGGAALVLALAALVIVMMRRRARPAAANPLMPKAFLNDIGGATGHKSYELGARPIIVGRLMGPDTDAADYVVIDESTVGRRHALLEYKEHSFWVSDQNSLNGTFVNNARIDTPTRLKHGDRIRFHKHEFEFLVLDMFETDRTMMSETVFAKMAGGPEDDDATVVREDAAGEPSPEDPTVTRP